MQPLGVLGESQSYISLNVPNPAWLIPVLNKGKTRFFFAYSRDSTLYLLTFKYAVINGPNSQGQIVPL
jgi:hypothetical protein